MEKIYVIHENGIWVEPLRQEFAARNLAFEEWDLSDGFIDLSKAPPEGIFYNRMSASSYTRGNRFAPEFTATVLNWLEAHGRRVINSSRALALEVNKSAQYTALQSYGVPIPRTVVAYGQKRIIEAAEQFRSGPVIFKPNRGGKGDLVRLFENVDELIEYVDSDLYQPAIDEIALLQEYIYAPDRSITRAEFIGGEFYYAVRVDTSDGFELCPADVCSVDSTPLSAKPKFKIYESDTGISPELTGKLEKVLAANGIEVAGIEFITDENGNVYVYDINTNTNYNSDAESISGVSGMGQLAEYLGQELNLRYHSDIAKETLRFAS